MIIANIWKNIQGSSHHQPVKDRSPHYSTAHLSTNEKLPKKPGHRTLSAHSTSPRAKSNFRGSVGACEKCGLWMMILLQLGMGKKNHRHSEGENVCLLRKTLWKSVRFALFWVWLQLWRGYMWVKVESRKIGTYCIIVYSTTKSIGLVSVSLWNKQQLRNCNNVQ